MSHPSSPLSRAPAPEVTARVLSAVVLALALLASVVVLVVGDSGASASPTAFDGSGGPFGGDGGDGGDGGEAGYDGGSETGPQHPDSHGTTTPGGGPGTTQLQTDFPFPPGSRPAAAPSGSPPGTQVRTVDRRLAAVRAFYDRKLAAAGAAWIPGTTTTSDDGETRVIGWHGFPHGADGLSLGYLALDEDVLGDHPGQVTITWEPGP